MDMKIVVEADNEEEAEQMIAIIRGGLEMIRIVAIGKQMGHSSMQGTLHYVRKDERKRHGRIAKIAVEADVKRMAKELKY
jgi:hypothetical protein